jgi:hypothetical protein
MQGERNKKEEWKVYKGNLRKQRRDLKGRKKASGNKTREIKRKLFVRGEINRKKYQNRKIKKRERERRKCMRGK